MAAAALPSFLQACPLAASYFNNYLAWLLLLAFSLFLPQTYGSEIQLSYSSQVLIPNHCLNYLFIHAPHKWK